MKISNLIALLANTQETYGDLGIMVQNGDQTDSIDDLGLKMVRIQDKSLVLSLGKTDPEGYETGICSYKIVHEVHEQTSGNELRGADLLFGTFPTDGDAARALAADPRNFRRVEYGWRSAGGYTNAQIVRAVKYNNHKGR